MLHERILHGIKDDSLVLTKAESRGPLHKLVEDYMVLAIHDDQLPNITVATTGRELKDALELLEPEIELELLRKYVDAQNEILYPHLRRAEVETAAAVDERKHRHWLIKVTAITLLVFFLGGVGAVGAIAFRSGNLPDSKVITVLMSFASDVAKLIFSSK